MLEIRWIKQKAIGMAMVSLLFVSALFLDIKDIVMLTAITVMFGVPMLVSKQRLFKYDYIIEIDICKILKGIRL